MTMIQVQGVSGVRRMLAPFLEPELSAELQAATRAGAEVLRRPLTSELGMVSKRMAGAVSIRKAKRDRPATVVGSRRKKAFFWHMIVGGTRDHGPRAAPFMLIGLNARRGSGSRKVLLHGPGALRGLRRTRRVRGIEPNPILARVAAEQEARVQNVMMQHITRRRR